MTNKTDKNSNETQPRAEAQSKIEQADNDTNIRTNPDDRRPFLAVYDRITACITAQLEKGVVPWRKPWNVKTGFPRNFVSGKLYRGVNVFLLLAMHFESPFWLTFKQVTALGGCVRRGEKGCPIVFWKQIPVEDEASSETRGIPVLRYYHVFNLTQCSGIDSPACEFTAAALPAEQIIAGMPQRPTIRHGMDQAFYSPVDDWVAMPEHTRFVSEAEYFGTLFHELTHATGHPSRLNRPTLATKAGFGSDAYCKEELIAEMGAAFMCGHAGIADRTLENSAAYINGWLERLQEDSTLLVRAAAQAQKAADFILGFDPKEGKAHE